MSIITGKLIVKTQKQEKGWKVILLNASLIFLTNSSFLFTPCSSTLAICFTLMKFQLNI